MKLDNNFWKNKRVFITGHTGFKGSWMTLWLNILGCKVCGFSLEPNTKPSLFNTLDLEKEIDHNISDIRDYDSLSKVINSFQPDIVFHFAAQPLVRYSYENPLETYSTNVMGTVNLLEAVKNYGKSQATIVITSDKCYENKEQIWGYRETDPMGGHDPYSNSKGCSELVVSSYTNSYFIPNKEIGKISSVRAGNVIGGGDWSVDRLIPDLVRSLSENQNPVIRSPNAIRPWQHVIEPLYGYLLIAQYLCDLEKQDSLISYNFGPDFNSQQNVGFIAEEVCKIWGSNKVDTQPNNNLHEANLLYLDCAKVKKEIGWSPRLDIVETLNMTIDWYKNFYSDKENNMLEFSTNQINTFINKSL